MQVQVQVKSRSSILAAAKKMKIKAVQNDKVRGYLGKTTRADIVFKLEGPYDVGFVKQKDGTYKAIYDPWQGHVERQLGRNLNKFMQFYTLAEVERQARLEGYYVGSTKTDKEGNIVVELYEA